MLTLKQTVTVIAASLMLFGCTERGSIDSFRTFSPRDVPNSPDFRTPFTAPIVVVEHSLGYSRVSIMAERGAESLYVESGQGEALPVTIYIKMPKGLRGAVRNVHRSLELSGQYQFSGVLTDAVNRDTALAFAKEVLARSYCVGGDITENHNAQIVDTNGPQPVARAFPMISSSPPGGRFTPGWTVNLRCGLWAKPL